MDSIYFEDPLGLLIELASYRFEPPVGFTHAEVLLEAHKLRVERGDYNIAPVHLADAIEALVRRSRASLSDDRSPKHALPLATTDRGARMAANTLNVLMPSVNNLTARVFVRAAGLDFEEVDVWGKTTTPEFLAKDPAHLTPMLEEEGLPKGSLWESCAIMQYLCNKHGLDQFYPTDPGRRAMVDSAMFYLIGTLYPLVARATYPTLGFPQYPGEVGTSEAGDDLKAQAQEDATAALAEPLDVYRAFFLDGNTFIGGATPSIADIRLAATLEFLNAIDYEFPAWAQELHDRGGVGPRRRLLGAGGRRARLRRLGEVTEWMSRWTGGASATTRATAAPCWPRCRPSISWEPAVTTADLLATVHLPQHTVLHLLHELNVDGLAGEAGGRWRRGGDLPPPPSYPASG